MRKQSQRKLNEYQQHGEAWDGTGRDPPNVRKAKKAKATKLGSQCAWTRWSTKEWKLNWEKYGG